MKTVALCLVLLAGTAFAGLLEEGQKAYDDRNGEKAAQLWQRACDGGKAEACVQLGNLYYKGRDVERDWDRAERLFKKACDAGEMRGCNNLASTIYKSDEESPEAFRRASDLYRHACAKGFGMSCYNLGDHYLMGEGVGRDEGKALALYEEACAKAYAKACYDLANMHHEQTFGSESDMKYYRDKKDEFERYSYRQAKKTLSTSRRNAFKYYKLTCKYGGAQGCDQVGKAYEEGGFGIKKDLQQAKKYYDRACEITYQPNYYGYSCKGSEHLEAVKLR